MKQQNLAQLFIMHWKNYSDAAVELIQNLIPGDNPKFAGYLISFSNDAGLEVNTTNDPEPMVRKLEHLKPTGGSALYDAIYMACTNRKLIQGKDSGDGVDAVEGKSEKTLRQQQRAQWGTAQHAPDGGERIDLSGGDGFCRASRRG